MSEPLKILLVEDEFLIAVSLEDMLVDAGNTVIGIADSFENAIVLADAQRPDLAFIDVQILGTRNGYQVAEEFRRRGIPCIFATGNCATEQGRGLAVACLHKPFMERDVLVAVDVVRKILRGEEPAKLPRSMHLL